MPEMLTDEQLLVLAAKIGEYMGQERWQAKLHHNGATLMDPTKPDLGLYLYNTWPRGRVTINGTYVQHRDGAYDRTWHYHEMEITVDPARLPQVLAADIKRRLLPNVEKRFLEIIAQREEFFADIKQCRATLKWLNDWTAMFDPTRDAYEEREVPYAGNHEKWLNAGLRTFRLKFCGGKLESIQVDCALDFAEAVIGLHVSMLPELCGYWRLWDVEDNEPVRYVNRRRAESGELRGDFEKSAADYYSLVEHSRFQKLQVRRLGETEWHFWSPVVEPSSVA